MDDINADAIEEDLECPFCDAVGFDKIGLKEHLLGYNMLNNRQCKAFAEIEELA